jgi:U3 small nucleolar RNA-associated protein 14
MMQQEKVCKPCEREKAKLPTYRKIARSRAINENKIISVVFDEEDKKYIIMDYETARQRQCFIIEYFMPV